jgi:hypothetical protein
MVEMVSAEAMRRLRDRTFTQAVRGAYIDSQELQHADPLIKISLLYGYLTPAAAYMIMLPRRHGGRWRSEPSTV